MRLSLLAVGAAACSGGGDERPQAWSPPGTGTAAVGDEGSGAGTDSTTLEPGTTAAGSTCSSVAAARGWNVFFCDQGNGACAGYPSQPTEDCQGCCGGPSCDDLAQAAGWDAVGCDLGDNATCGGIGTPTWDCVRCCEASAGMDADSGDGTTGAPVDGFGYPVGDRTSYPAGGWQVWQVLGHHWPDLGGRHLAQDIARSDGGVATIDAAVYSVADGVVRYAGSNSSTYRNVVLIEHEVGGADPVCSFYGHIAPPMVSTGDVVVRGQQVSTVLDWAVAAAGPSSNTHLHYVLLSKPLCDASAAASGSLICGYDQGGPNGVETLADEPAYYTSVADVCQVSVYTDAFISPTQFIEAHHFEW